ncbi:hypothetical protein [Paenibacillus sp. TH7-28]
MNLRDEMGGEKTLAALLKPMKKQFDNPFTSSYNLIVIFTIKQLILREGVN